MLNNIIYDLRYAVRMLLKRPAFSAVVIITLALGTGANTAIFSVVDAALLRGLPYKNPDRIVNIWENVAQEASHQREASYPDFIDWKTNNHTFESMAGFGQASLILSGGDSSELVAAGRVSAEFFHVLGVDSTLGRVIGNGDDQQGAERVVVLSQGAWQRRFGSDQNIIGKSIVLGDRTYTVAGVLPASFHFAPLDDAELFVPLNPDPSIRERRFMHFVRVIGRLKDGVTVPQALTDMNTVGAQIALADPNAHANVTIKLVRLPEQIFGAVKSILFLLLIAVSFVLLIACANVANLFLVRSTSRQKEMAVRLALGASRGQLARQLLGESVVLSLIGGGLGLILAQVGVNLVLNAIPMAQLTHMPYLRGVGLNRNVLAYSLIVSLLSATVFALVPILQANKTDLQVTLKEGGRGAAGVVRNRLRGGLVAGEIALTLMLMIGVGLMLKSTIRLLSVNPGFDTNNLLTLQVGLVGPAYATEMQRAAAQQQLLARLQSLPGVAAAATVGLLPLNGGGNTATPIIEGRRAEATRKAPSANVRTVSPNYFHTIGIPLVEGRTFSEQDTARAPRAIVVNRTFVKNFFPNEHAIARRVTFIWDSGGQPWNIVGVVGDENVNTLDGTVTPVIYFPYLQDPEPGLNVVIRTRQEPLSLAAVVQNEIRSMDRTLPVSNVTSMNQLITDSPATFIRRYPALLIGIFAGVAMMLATIGLYGVISYSVAQRTQELGVRMALGAQRADIFRLVLSQGIVLTLLGVGVGLAGSFVLSRFLASLLFEVGPNDPLIICGVVVLMIGVALAACYLPARRAAKVDPLVALRYE